MLFSTRQMCRLHSLQQPDTYNIIINDSPASRVSSSRILGVKFSENLDWNVHIQDVLKSSYASLRTLQQLKRFTPYNLRKTLVQTLVLTKVL